VFVAGPVAESEKQGRLDTEVNAENEGKEAATRRGNVSDFHGKKQSCMWS